jgi:hypothetical protein
MIKSEIASCRSRPWLRKISLRDGQHDEIRPSISGSHCLRCYLPYVTPRWQSAKMAKSLAITIAKQQAKTVCSNSEMEPLCQF